MPATDTHQPQPADPDPPSPPRPAGGTDPVLLLTLGLVIALILGATFYLCVAHPRLAGPVSAVGGVAGGLTAAIGIAIAIRRRKPPPHPTPGPALDRAGPVTARTTPAACSGFVEAEPGTTGGRYGGDTTPDENRGVRDERATDHRARARTPAP